jgi:hypothetical protein
MLVRDADGNVIAMIDPRPARSLRRLSRRRAASQSNACAGKAAAARYADEILSATVT